jgi:hypothetical protein
MGSSVGKIIGGIALAIIAPEAIGAIAGMAADATSVAVGAGADLGLDAADAVEELPTVQPLDPITDTVTPTEGSPVSASTMNAFGPGPDAVTSAIGQPLVSTAADPTVLQTTTPNLANSVTDVTGNVTPGAVNPPSVTQIPTPGTSGNISSLITNPSVVDGALKAGGSVLSSYMQGQAMLQGKQFDANQAALKIQRNAAALAQAQRLAGTGGPNPSTLNSGYVTPAAQNALPSGVLAASNANLNPYTGS